MFELVMKTHFAAAHRLREYDGDCEHLHGHNWLIEVRLVSAKLNRLGMVVDFRDVKRILGRTFSNAAPKPDEDDCQAFLTTLAARGLSSVAEGARAAEEDIVAWVRGADPESALAQSGLGDPMGVARIIAFLASPDADYVRGTIFTR